MGQLIGFTSVGVMDSNGDIWNFATIFLIDPNALLAKLNEGHFFKTPFGY